MTGGGDMLPIAPHRSRWAPAKGALCAWVAVAWVAVLVLLGALLFAGSARAAASAGEPPGEASSSAAPVVEPAPEASSSSPAVEPAGAGSAVASAGEPASEASSSSPAEPAQETSSSTPPAVEPSPEASAPAPEASSTSSSSEPAPEASSSSLTDESAPEASSPAQAAEPAPEASPTPAAEPTPETLTPTEPVVAPAPEAPTPTLVAEPTPEASHPVEPVNEVKEVPTTDPGKETTEAPTDKPTLGQGAEGPSSPAASSPAPAVAENPTSTAAPEVLSAVGAPITAVIPDASEEVPTSSATTAALARTIAVQRAEDFNRELGGLGSSLGDGYTVIGSDARGLLPAPFVDGLAAVTAGRAGAHADDDPAGSMGGDPPIVPPAVPTPNGSFSGAAPGGSGVAPLAGFPAFAGRLLRGAPLAMRRLRLSFQPWLTAFFVLIPERPG